MNALLRQLDVRLPIIQAPMAGVSTPSMAASVSNAGGLGSIGVGAANAEMARQMIGAVRALTDLRFNVNVFCHQPATRDSTREAAWIARLAPEFVRYGAAPPTALREIYTSFVEDDAMLDLLVSERPRVVSFHFGLPSAERIAALRSVRMASGTCLVALATRCSTRCARPRRPSGSSAAPTAYDTATRAWTVSLRALSVTTRRGSRRPWPQSARVGSRPPGPASKIGFTRSTCCGIEEVARLLPNTPARPRYAQRLAIVAARADGPRYRVKSERRQGNYRGAAGT